MAVELVEPVKRVEQYLYALCVLDFSNIPVPRSRLEFFAHALITGVLPEFQAETREEVYITAIVTGDYANLPLPKSRADQLLYKICLGETEIRDIELETRYEMLLAYIAEHGDMPLETVLVECVKAFQTIPNTVEVPVESAILKGQTLVNKASIVGRDIANDGWNNLSIRLNYPLSINSKYLINIFNLPSDMNYVLTNSTNSDWIMPLYENKKTIFVSQYNSDDIIILHVNDSSTYRPLTQEEINKIQVIIIEYQEGMENWDIPYFEGMQSVEMPVLTTTGKNLFKTFKNNGYYYYSDSDTDTNNGSWINDSNFKCLSAKVLSNTQYIQSSKGDYTGNVLTFWKDGKFTGKGMRGKITGFITTPPDCDEIRASCPMENDLQLELGKSSTSYEPHKSNILTVNEEVELRGIDEVQDTLDLKTGEVTERIDKVVLDGSENWGFIDKTTDGLYNRFSLILNNELKSTLILCDKINGQDWDWWNSNKNNPPYNAIFGHGGLKQINLLIKISEVSDITSLKGYLKNNPITIQYQLKTESVKTVDLTIQDQDGNAVPCLSAFNDATHVSINAVDIIPQVDLEVRVDANTMANVALQQENVAVAQASLSDAIDAQNDDITMTKQALDEVKGE